MSKTNVLIIVIVQICFIINSALGSAILVSLLLKIYLDSQNKSIRLRAISISCLYVIAVIFLFYSQEYLFLLEYIDVANVIFALILVYFYNDLFIYNNIYSKSTFLKNIVQAQLFLLVNLDTLLIKRIKFQKEIKKTKEELK